MGGEGAGDIGGRHLDQLDFAGLDAPHLHGAQHQQALVGKAAGDGDGAAAQICDGFDGAVFADDDRAAVTMAQVDDLDVDSLGLQRKGQRGNDEGGLHAVGDQCFLDLRKALKQSGQEHFTGERVLGNVVGDRAGELAGGGEIGNGDFSFLRGLIVIQDRAPVHVEPGVQAGDEQQPGEDAEDDFSFKTHRGIPSERI